MLIIDSINMWPRNQVYQSCRMALSYPEVHLYPQRKLPFCHFP